MKPSKKIAVGGITAALSIAFLFLTGVIPIATFAIPAFCGAMLIVVYIEIGMKEALLVYFTVCLLALIATPDREAAALYILLFGYYPILKDRIERLHSHLLVFFLKCCVLLLAGGLFVLGNLFLFNLNQLHWNLWLIAGGCAAVVIVFFLYDLALAMIGQLYWEKIRPTYLHRFFKD